MIIKKRGKGKIKNCLTLKDMYQFYIENYKTDIDFKTFSKVTKLCNSEILKVITEEAKEFIIPYRLGSLLVCKYERSFNGAKNKWAINYKKSKELGFTIYHDQEAVYAWRWRKRNVRLTNKSRYGFVASRKAKRAIPKAVKEKNIDYFQ